MRRPLSLALLAALALGATTPDAEAQRRRRPAPRRSAPAATQARPTALVVLLENGGVAANLEECLGQGSSKVQIPVAVSGHACFALRKGESLPQALLRLKNSLAAFALNPSAKAWKVETMGLDDWVQHTSDFLLEEVSKRFHRTSGLSSLYDRVILLEDEALTPANAVAKIRGLGPGYDIDVHTLVHGGVNSFSGFEGVRFNEASFFGPLRGRGLQFRAVYQMNCVSGTLMDEWLALGADVVNGTLDERNNYMPHQYFHFQDRWVGGDTFGNAITQSYSGARGYSEPVYEALGMLQEIEDSRMRVLGATGLRAKPTPLQVATGVVLQGIETARDLARRLKAAGESMQEVAAALLAAGHDALACADALRREFACDAEEAARAMLQAGYALGDIGAGLAQSFACSAGDMYRALRQAGGEVRAVLGVMLERQSRSLQEVVQAAVDAGEDLRPIVDALASSTIGKSYSQIVKALARAGVRPASLAKVLRAKGRSAKDVARWLKGAGVSGRGVAKALAAEFKCGVRDTVKHLKSAGFDFNVTAKAVWREVIRRTKKSGWPAAIAELTNELASRFQLNIGWVAAEVAKLGIKP